MRAAAPDGTKPEHNRSWTAVSGLATDVRFETLTRADGIPAEEFYQVLQDHRGFIWFTTKAGLVRFDGYREVVYPGVPLTRTPPRTKSVPGFLFEDHQGTLWVATNVLTRFDPATGKFMESLNPRPGPARPGVDYITAIHDGSGGSLWVGVYSYSTDKVKPQEISDPVLYEVKPGGASVQHPIPRGITESQGPLPAGQRFTIRAIEEDTRGRVWLGTSLGLVRFDPATGAFQHYPHTHSDPDMWPQKQFNALVWDMEGRLWVHMPAGLERFDPDTGVFDRFTAAEFWYMFADPRGRIWLWGGYPGLKVLDPSAPVQTALKSIFFITASGRRLEETEIETLGCDRQGNVWAYPASGNVPFRYSPALVQFGSHRPDRDNPNSVSGPVTLQFAGSDDGATWIAVDEGGLNRYDARLGNITRYHHEPRNPHSLSSDKVTSIYEDRSHRFWVGTGEGLIESFDRKSGRSALLRGPHMKYPVTSMFEDSSGRFWVGAFLGPLYQVDRSTGAVTPMNIKGGYVTFEDRAGNLWFGAPPGANKLDRQGNVRMVPLRQPDAANPAPTLVTSIYEDPGGMMWMSSSRGLYELDPGSEKVTSYGTREGLATEDIRCLLPDGDGNFWMSTDQGISRFDRREKRFYNYDEREGLQGKEFQHFSCYRAPDGRLYFGGRSGFNEFFPREILAREPEPRIALTAFQINGKETPVVDIGGLRLEHGQNGLSFEFAVLNAINPGKYRYRFKLDGLEKEWIEVDSEHRLGRYTELAPASYTFRAEASGDGRSWTGKGATLAITILPPWWKTWWALVLEALLFAGGLVGSFKLRVRALQRRQRELSNLVDQRTAELVESRDREHIAREQAQVAADQAQVADRAKSAFLANMSHELRTPLSAILGFSSLLRASDLTDEQREQIITINHSGEHLLGLINDVLDVAKIEAGKQELAIVPSDLIATVRTVMEMMRVRAEDKNLSLVFDQTPDVPRYVRVDAPKLRQILINLIGNGLKFTKEGAVILRLRATPRNEPGRVQLRFDIQDSGVGISQHDLGRIFEPFEQVRKSGEETGTGLGLTITRRFVEMMGGTLRVESEIGRGSCFTLEMTVELAREAEINGEDMAHGQSFMLESGQPECRVLIVEDDQENATLLRQILTRAAFSVRVAENGVLGIEAFQEWRPDFIWMDLGMPQMSGTEATRRIRGLEGGAKVKIVALTASAYASDREEVIRAGFDDFTFKPFRPAELFGCMARHLGIRYSSPGAAKTAHTGEPGPIRPGAVAALPCELRNRLKDAVTSLNTQQIESVTEDVGRRDEALGHVLRQLGKRYAYTAILTAIERAELESASPASDTVGNAAG